MCVIFMLECPPHKIYHSHISVQFNVKDLFVFKNCSLVFCFCFCFRFCVCFFVCGFDLFCYVFCCIFYVYSFFYFFIFLFFIFYFLCVCNTHHPQTQCAIKLLVYRKPTHTDQYLNSCQNTPPSENGCNQNPL